MFLYYKNSILASIFSIFGSGFVAMGVMFVIEEGEIVGAIVMAALGIAMILLGRNISQNKAFKKWWKQQIEEKGLVPHIVASMDIAVQIYNKNPGTRALKKIRQLNPAAADWIEQHQTK